MSKDKTTNSYVGDFARTVCNYILKHYDDAKEMYTEFFGTTGVFQENGKWVAYDNTTGDCWVEEFKTKREAERWVDGLFDVV